MLKAMCYNAITPLQGLIMKRYRLQVLNGTKLLEDFENRNKDDLNSILSHHRMHRAYETDAFGTPLDTPNRFIIHNSLNDKLYDGNVAGAIAAVSSLKKK